MENNTHFSLNKTQLVFWIVFMSIVFSIAGFLFYRNEEQKVKIEKQNEIKTVSLLKIKQISDWYNDELHDAAIISKSNFFTNQIEEWQRTNLGFESPLFKTYLNSKKLEHDYDEVILSSIDSKNFTSSNIRDSLPSIMKEKIRESLKNGAEVCSDIYKVKDSLRIDFISPIRSSITKKIIAVFIFRFDPNVHLFPIITRWPTSSSTSEIYMARREKDSVVVLNQLRFSNKKPLEFKYSLEDNKSAIVRGVKGNVGLTDAVDYAGNEVLAYVNQVPNTHWFLISKINKDELFENFYFEVVVIISFTIGLILIFVFGISFIYYNRQRNVYRELYKKQNELMQAEAIAMNKLLDSEAKLRRAEFVSRSGNWELDLSKMEIHGSDGAQELYGLRGKTYNLSMIQKVPLPEYSEMMSKALAELITKNIPYNIEFKIKQQSTGEILFLNSIASYDKEKNRVFGVIRDITEKKKMIEELIAAKEKAEEMVKIKSFFFANMSHELRTPFMGLMGYAQLLLELVKSEEEREMVEGIIRTSNRLTNTLTLILDFTKLEFDKTEIFLEEINPGNLISEVYNQYLAAAEKKGLSLIKEIHFEPFNMTTDGRLLSEILINLINNAIKYTDNGWVKIEGIKRTEDNEDELLDILVSDSGIGITNEKQSIIWDEFRQASEGTNRAYQGTGLGLSITKRYTELIGGKIELISKFGEGSTFKVEIPIKKVPNKS
ncbi:MAG: ATP-binding protein [Ignavibacteriaceae bacterium]|jgi:PAS domain S-box-containing protein|nr:ATP-binding protein [Ignavibacteriaceae bacterium]